MSGTQVFVNGDSGYFWLQCFADDPDADKGLTICQIDAGSEWDSLAALVAEHVAEHGCTQDAAKVALPGWEEMSDLDKGAALMHLHKRGREGAEYAVSDYPCRYLSHPALTALTPEAASVHAASLARGDGAWGVPGLEWDEAHMLYDLALDAGRARYAAEREAGEH